QADAAAAPSALPGGARGRAADRHTAIRQASAVPRERPHYRRCPGRRSRAYLVAALLHGHGAGRVLLAQVGGRGRLSAREGNEASRSRSPRAPARGDRTTTAHGLGVPVGAPAVGAGREAI